MKEFISIKPEHLNENTFSLLGADWMLITSGKTESFNTMTASWGGMGVLWNKNVCFIFVRPQRHTFSFLENNETFTLCFFHEKYREVLKFCGSKSGRDVNKAEETGITPCVTDTGAVYFRESRLVIECKKIYWQDIDPKNFLESSIARNYPDKDYHRLYIGEILDMMIK